MPIKPLALYTNFYSSDFFSLAMKRDGEYSKIIMKLSRGTVNTRELPKTFALLKKILPSVLKSTCYNENHYPFYKEVLHTEIGHLFEHILIEYLCLLKLEQGEDEVEVRGVTKWNWVDYPKGSFHITVTSGADEVEVFAEAMEKAIALINTILASGQQIVVNSPYQIGGVPVPFVNPEPSSVQVEQVEVSN